jgi:hypothetical protein
VELHPVAVFGNKLFCDRAQCFAQILSLLIGAVADSHDLDRTLYLHCSRSTLVKSPDLCLMGFSLGGYAANSADGRGSN